MRPELEVELLALLGRVPLLALLGRLLTLVRPLLLLGRSAVVGRLLEGVRLLTVGRVPVVGRLSLVEVRPLRLLTVGRPLLPLRELALPDMLPPTLPPRRLFSCRPLIEPSAYPLLLPRRTDAT